MRRSHNLGGRLGNASPRAMVHSPRRNRRRLLAIEPLASRLCLTGNLELLFDINAELDPVTSFPSAMMVVNDTALFLARHEDTGYELWKTNGTSQGTTLVRDIYPGPEGSGMNAANVVFNGALYFVANDGVHGHELWRSDGTLEGTSMVEDIHFGPASSQISDLYVSQGLLYFVATDGISGKEVWRSDGTSAGTYAATNFNPEGPGSGIDILGVGPSGVYFDLGLGVHNHQLFFTNGTFAGTESISFSMYGFGDQFAVIGSIIYFSTLGPTGTAYNINRFDGTPFGTSVLLSELGDLSDFVEVDGELYFTASIWTSGSPNFFRQHVWRTDGTPGGTQRLTDFPGAPIEYFDLTAVGNNVFFSALDTAHGLELWKTTSNSITLVKDIYPGPFPNRSVPGFNELGPRHLGNVNGGLVFSASSSGANRELWTSDGTEAGTLRATDIYPGPVGSSPSPTNQFLHGADRWTQLGNEILLIANHPDYGRELWATDLTESGTHLVKNIHGEGTQDANPFDLEVVNGTLFFEVNSPTVVDTLWRSFGTSTSTISLPIQGAVGEYAAFNGITYFIADVADTGKELFATNSNREFTYLVADLVPGAEGSDPRDLISVNNTLYFSALDGLGTRKLWAFDGFMIQEVTGDAIFGPAPNEPMELTNVAERLYFTAVHPDHGRELWTVDGITAYEVVDIRPDAESSNPHRLSNLDGRLLFLADDGQQGNELWISEGADWTTYAVTDLAPGTESIAIESFTIDRNIAYFTLTGSQGAFDGEPWRTDGTLLGTYPLFDISAGPSPSNPRQWLVFDEMIYFTADDGIHGEELWRTNGTSEGTELIADVYPGLDSSYPYQLIAGNSQIYFIAYHPSSGREVWEFEPSSMQSQVFDDLTEDSTSSFPSEIAFYNGNLYVVAETTEFGIELYYSGSSSFPTDITLSQNTIPENTPPNTVLATLTTLIDGEVGDGTYELVSGPGSEQNHFFTIDENRLRNNMLLDFELLSQLHFRVRVTTSNGDTLERALVMEVLDQPEGSAKNDLFRVEFVEGHANVTITSTGRPTESLGSFPTGSHLHFLGFGGADTLQVVGQAANESLLVNANGWSLNGFSLSVDSIEKTSFDLAAGQDQLAFEAPISFLTAVTYSGGAGDDTYRFDADVPLGSVILSESAGGTDTLDFSSTFSTSVSVDLGLSLDQIVNPNLTLRLSSGSTFENLVGGAQSDVLIGNARSNTLTGMAGNDLLDGKAGNDIFTFDLDASTGIDQVSDTSGIDTIDFSTTSLADITFSLAESSAQPIRAASTLQIANGSIIERLIGGDGNDRLTGNAASNWLEGKGGNDELIGESGNDVYRFDVDHPVGHDTILDSLGVDTLDYSESSQFGVAISLDTTLPQTVAPSHTLTLLTSLSIENLTGSTQNDTIVGSSKNNLLIGGPGDDTINGGAGNDTYLFQADHPLGLDTISDSSGVDIFTFSSTLTLGVTIDLANTSPQIVNANLSLHLLSDSSIETVIGSPRDDSIIGNSLDNTITGGAGNDSLAGGPGNDRYLFNATMPLGADVLEDSLGIDTLDFSSTTLPLLLDLDSLALQTVASGLSLTFLALNQIETILGGKGSDTLFGNALDNTLTGGPGDDYLDGRAGNDTYLFDADALLNRDTIHDDIGELDTLDFSKTTTAGISLDLNTLTWQTIRGGFHELLLTSAISIERVFGSTQSDAIFGNARNNTLIGLAGNDLLVGNAGRDLLFGGGGADALQGGDEQDLLISGTTLFDSNALALASIQAEWASPTPYATRVDRLRNGLDGLPSLSRTRNVRRDNVANSLIGDTDYDWFFADLSSGLDTSDAILSELHDEL